MRRASVAGILGALALGASAVLAGADEKAKGEPVSGWFPVAVGHRWQYTETTAEGEARPVVFRVESTEERADREVFVVAVTVFSDYEDEDGKVRKVGARGRADETGDARIAFEVEALEAVAVGDRKHPCYRVRETFEGASGHTSRWYAKGVGLVKEQVVAGDGRTRSLGLTSYAPAKEERP